jgi:hypothetical protein
MSVRTFRRAAFAAAVVSMFASSVAFADSVRADGDLVTAGQQALIELGAVAPGATIHADVGFSLNCGGLRHVNADQTVRLSLSAITVPTGASATATDTEIAPPGGWPIDFASCTGSEVPVYASTPSHITLTAPTVPAMGYSFILSWSRTLVPAAANDSNTFTGGTAITFMLDVVSNTAPTLTVPSDMTVEGNTTGGANVTFSTSATDAEDDPDPTPTCSAASGSFFPLGTTSVSCSVTDSGGMSASGGFSVTVVDTTAPSMSGVTADISADTTNASGTTVTYSKPTATDVVDASPSVSCAPASGSTFPVGDTTVHCTATDGSANAATASFGVHVDFHQPPHWNAIWDEPVGAGLRLSVSSGRTIPIKVRVFVDGHEVTSGSARLATSWCGGGTAEPSIALEWRAGSGRWYASDDASGLSAGCYEVAVKVGAATAGSFELDVVGSSASAAKANSSQQKNPGSKGKP